MFTQHISLRRLTEGSFRVVLIAMLLLGAVMWSVPAQAKAPEKGETAPLLDAPPAVSLNVPATAFIGSTVSFTVTFDNTDTVPGYGPLIDLIIPTNGADGNQNTNPPLDGLTFVSATYLGVSVESTVLTFPGSGGVTCVNHPYMVDNTGSPIQVCGNAGDTFVALRLPFGSFTPDQPPLVVNVTASMSNLADLGAPLTIQARGGYQFGYTPLNDYTSDPPSATLSGWTSGSVTPTLFTLSKTYNGPEDETATGPNFPRRYTVTAEIAPGQSMTAFTLSDILPDNMQFVSVVSTNPGGAACTHSNPAVPDGTLSCVFGGSVSGAVSMTFEYYIPLRDAGGASVIDPVSGDDVPSCNNASGGGTWTPVDPRDAGGTFTQDPSGCEHTLTDKSIAIQKSVSVVGGGDPAPGKYLQYTLDFQVSDFFAFQNVVVTDVISDGQHFDSSFAPTLQVNGNTYVLTAAPFDTANYTVDTSQIGNTGPNPPPDGTDGSTTLTFRISDEMISRGQDGRLIGGCVPPTGTGGGDPSCGGYNDGPTTGRIVFRTLIQQNFTDTYPSGDPSVDQGDTLNNGVTIAGDLLSTSDATTVTGQAEDDDSAASVSIGRGALTKSIYAVNGSTSFGSPVEVKPGDTVTYRLTSTLPTGDVENLKFEDYLPLPVFHVGDPDEDGTAGPAWVFDDTVSAAAPAAGHAKFGPSDTFRAYSGIVPTLTSDTANNRLDFTYGSFDGPTEQPYTVDILFTVTVSNAPFADRLQLTNQAHAFQGSTNAGAAEVSAITQIVLTEPVLVMKKGIIWASNASATFNPNPPGPVTFLAPASSPRWSGTINSTNLAATPINSNLSGVDAGDIVTFAIVIENTGSSGNGAFDIRLRDDLPSGFVIPSGGLNLQVYRGDGTPVGGLGYTGLGGGPDGINGTADDLFGSGIEITDPGAAEGASQQYHPNNGKNIVLVTFDLEVASSVPAGAQIVNTATLFNYAGSEGGPDHTSNDLTDTAITQVRYPGLSKVFTTEINNPATGNGQTQAVIGEFVDYTLTITVPEGAMSNVTLTDTLPAGLAFVDCLSITPSAGLSTDLSGGFSAACNDPANPTVNAGGQTFTFTLGTITNANRDNSVDETIAIVFRAVVLNIASNQAGTTLRNTAQLLIDGGAGGTASVQSADLTIIEPVINTTKSVSPTSADAGDTVTFTVTLSNPASGSTTAYDVTWSDTLPSGLTYAPGTLTLGACTASTPLTLSDASAPTLSGSGGLFQPGQTCTITFQATVNYSAAPGQIITNTAETRWTSLPGSVTDRSPYNTDSDERTGADGVGGALDDYASQGQAAVTINTITPQKYLAATSEAHTGDPGDGISRVAIGEIVRYRLVVQLPEGSSPNFQIRDNLPGGLTYLDDGTARLAFLSDTAPIASTEPTGSTLALALGNGPFGAGPWVSGSDPTLVTPTYVLPDQNVGSSNSLTADPDAYGNGTDPYFKLGTLTNNDSDADGEYVIIEFNALVNNSAAGSNDAGDARNNTFSVFISGAQNGADSNQVQVIIAEPLLTLAKALTTAPSDAGDPVTYTLTITAASGNDRATAFDLTLSDTFDANLTALSVSSVVTSQGAVCTGNGSGTTAFSHNGGVFAGNTLTFTATCLDPGQTITITVSGAVAASAPVGYVIPNTANLTYTSLPGSNGTTSNPTGSTTPGGSGSDTGERDGSDGVGGAVDDYAATSSVNAPLSAPVIAKQAPTPSGYPIGATATYPIRITLPEGVTRAVRVTDAVPSGMQYVSFSVDTTGYNGTVGAPTVTCAGSCGNGDDVTFDFGDITTADDNNPANNAFTLNVTLRVLDVPANQIGSVLTNGASLTYTPGTGSSDTTLSGGTQDITVLEPRIATTKTVNPASDVQAGDTLTYTVRFTNTGTAIAYDVTAEDILAQGVTYNNDASCIFFDGSTSASIGVSVTAGAGTLAFDGIPAGSWDIPVNGYIECTYTATAQSSLYLDGNHTNTVDADWSSLDGVDANERVYDDTVSRTVDGTQDTATATFTSPAPTFDKSDNAASLPIGGTYQVTLTLTSPLGTLRGLTITDILPAGLIYISGSQSVSGGIAPAPTFSVSAPNDGSAPVTLTWTFGDAVVSSSPITITYNVRMANVSGNQNGVTLTNQARLDYTDAGGTAKSLSDTDDVTVIEPELDVQKTASNPAPGVGQTFTYTLTVQHLSGSTANAFDLTISDTLPASIQVTLPPTSSSAPPGCAGSITDASAGNLINLTVASLPLDCVLTVQYNAVIISPPANPGDVIVNDASLLWSSLAGVDPNERDGSGGVNDYADTASDSVTLTNPDLTITKTDGQLSYVPGTSLTYIIVVSNVGNGDAIGATVSDTIPAGITSWTWTCSGATGGATGCDPYSGSDDFSDVVDLPAGSSITYTVIADIASSATGDLTNTASVAPPSGITDPTPGNNSASDTDTQNSQTALSVTKDDSLTVVAPGSVITYTITVNNAGPSDAFGVSVSDPIPPQIASWEWTCVLSDGSACSGSGGPISTNFNGTVDIPAAASATYTVTATLSATASGTLTNTVTVSHPGDSNPADNSDDDVDVILTLPGSDLTKTLIATNQTFTSDSSVAIGEILTYRIAFRVPAGGSLPNLTLTDTLDRGLAFVNCVSVVSSDPAITTDLPGGFSAACNAPTNPTVATEPPGSPNPADAGRRVTFTLGTVSNTGATDGTVVIDYTAVVLNSLENQDGLTLNNNATLTWDSGALTASAPEVTIVEPDLELTKSVDRTVALPGSTLTFTLTFRHTALSNVDAFDVVLTDVLPAGLTYVPGSLTIVSGPAGGVTDDAAAPTLRVTWANFPLLSGGSRTEAVVRFQAVLGPLSPGRQVRNAASLAWTSLPGDVSAPQSPYNRLSTERFYDPPSDVNVYGIQADVAITVPRLPSTGFAPGVITSIPEQPAEKAYQALGDLWLEIPKLGVKMPIVGIPAQGQEWDLTWLSNQAGWLEGTAYPTHAGNSALTAHVYLPNGQPGPFVNLGSLRWGDQVIVHLGGQRYIFEVRQAQQVSPYSLSALRHEEYPWLTLITCREYDAKTGAYKQRVVVRAVLVKVEAE